MHECVYIYLHTRTHTRTHTHTNTHTYVNTRGHTHTYRTRSCMLTCARALSPPPHTRTHAHISNLYGVATVRRIDRTIGLFCRILLLLLGSFAKETYILIDPTNQSHLIPRHRPRSRHKDRDRDIDRDRDRDRYRSGNRHTHTEIYKEYLVQW